jgi:hypothetical protein
LKEGISERKSAKLEGLEAGYTCEERGKDIETACKKIAYKDKVATFLQRFLLHKDDFNSI